MKLDQDWRRLRSTNRKQAMASLLALTRVAPHLRFHTLIADWTLAEAKAWLRLVRHETPSLTAARRAAALLDLSWRSKDPAAFVYEARLQFDRVSDRDRRRMPGLWASILLRTEPSSLRPALPRILSAVRKSRRAGHQFASSWILDQRIPEDARAIVKTWVAGLADWELEPSVRLRFAEQELVRATQSGREDVVAACVHELTRWAPYCRYLTDPEVISAAMKFSLARGACRAFVDVLLEREKRPARRRILLGLRSRLRSAVLRDRRQG